MKLGMPKAMSYYYYYPFLYGFFKALGVEIILSDNTTKKTLAEGASRVVTETCLPVKVFVGHVLNLIEKGVDKIFVPSYQSIAPKIYNCSKIRGLPDLIRNVVKEKFTLVEPTLDKSAKNQGLKEFLVECASYFNITDMNLIKEAEKAGWKVWNNFNVMLKSGIQYAKALDYAIQGKVCVAEEDKKDYPITIALVSHAYNIYDERTSMKIFEKLDKMNVRVCTALQLSQEHLVDGISALGQSYYWANETEMTGCAGHYMKDSKVDGMITLTAFGCGPDSLMLERITRKAKEYAMPLLNLTIDEHTGEAGFVTRLEAFVDMLFRKQRAAEMQKV